MALYDITKAQEEKILPANLFDLEKREILVPASLGALIETLTERILGNYPNEDDDDEGIFDWDLKIVDQVLDTLERLKDEAAKVGGLGV